MHLPCVGLLHAACLYLSPSDRHCRITIVTRAVYAIPARHTSAALSFYGSVYPEWTNLASAFVTASDAQVRRKEGGDRMINPSCFHRWDKTKFQPGVWVESFAAVVVPMGVRSRVACGCRRLPPAVMPTTAHTGESHPIPSQCGWMC